MIDFILYYTIKTYVELLILNIIKLSRVNKLPDKTRMFWLFSLLNTAESRVPYRFLCLIKGYRSLYVHSNEETQFLTEMSKVLNVIYEDNFQSRAIFQSGPFSVYPNSCVKCSHIL